MSPSRVELGLIYIAASLEDIVILVSFTNVVTAGSWSDPGKKVVWSCIIRSKTHWAVSLASASWSQHSSIVWRRVFIPCVGKLILCCENVSDNSPIPAGTFQGKWNKLRDRRRDLPMDHFTVVAKLPGIRNGSKASGDPALIQIFALFMLMWTNWNKRLWVAYTLFEGFLANLH